MDIMSAPHIVYTYDQGNYVTAAVLSVRVIVLLSRLHALSLFAHI